MRLLKLLLAIGLCLNIPLVALAHSGRTDSSGGHYDYDTGEYHYHHGFSAHQHEDTDGDGILDCPYRINGKLETDSSSSSNKITRPKKPLFDSLKDALAEKEETEYESTEKETTKKKSLSSKESKTFWDHVLDVLGFLLQVVCFYLVFFAIAAVCKLIGWIIKKIFKQ